MFFAVAFLLRLQTLMNKVQNAQESDTTKADSSNTACHQKTLT